MHTYLIWTNNNRLNALLQHHAIQTTEIKVDAPVVPLVASQNANANLIVVPNANLVVVPAVAPVEIFVNVSANKAKVPVPVQPAVAKRNANLVVKPKVKTITITLNQIQ